MVLESLSRRLLTCAILALFVVPLSASAQTPTATVSGTAYDATGAVLPGVRVAITDVDRNTTQTTVTNENGGYVLPALPPGRYSVLAEREGFRRFLREGIVLQVNQTAEIDLRLEVGAVNETLLITAPASMLETETSSRGSVIDQQKILELPLDGRDYNRLALLSPGVLPSTPRLAIIGFRGALNVNGNRVFDNVFLLDGVDNVSYSSSYRGENVQVVQPSVEALQEFKIQTNGYSAEFGRSSGAVVNAATRSGSNAIRGSVYEFLRNDALDANNFFSNAFGSPKPERKRNQFGAAVGGPIVRDRVFWFADYEGVRGREGVAFSRAVPTPEEKAGLFATPVFDPFDPSRPPFGQNGDGMWVIPKDRWDPVGAAIVATIPDPNVPGTNLYASTPTTRTRTDQFDVRIDYQISQDTQLFGRYSFADSEVFRPAPLPGLAESSFSDAFGSSENRSQGLAVGLTRSWSPNLVGNLRLGWTHGNYFTYPPNFGIDGPAMVGLQNVPSDPEIVGGLPKIGLQGYDAIGRHTSTPQFQTPRTWNPRATFSLHRGTHSLKFGYELLRAETRINDLTATIGAMSFADLFTGRAVGDLLLGLPSLFSLTSFTVIDQGQNLHAVFVQDDFRVSPSLTLNLGVRYEYATPPMEKDNRLANFDPATGTMMLASDGSTFDRALIHPDRNDWAPRIGFAWSPAPAWVVRDLAELYGVRTGVLNQAVKRNVERFPSDFMFGLNSEEADSLRSQSVTLNAGRGQHRKYLPYAFTEQGVAMLSSVLRSKRAVQVNIEIMRAFVRLRQILASDAALARKLDALEKKYDGQFRIVFDAIRELMAPEPIPPKRQIGFKTDA